MQNIRLMERIEQWEDRACKREGVTQKHCIDSVIDHLNKVLNVRQGSTLMDPEYGLPDFSGVRTSYPDCLNDLQQAVTQTIERYEPRLRDVHVEFIDKDSVSLRLLFRIEAMLHDEGEDRHIFLESSVDANGRMLFRG